MTHVIEKLTKGLQILEKYPDSQVSAEHDTIYAGPDATKVSSQDVKELEDLGWTTNGEFNCWTFFL